MNFKEFIPTFKEIPRGEYPFRFTVFTPAYNCAKTIEKVHIALEAQSFKNFEWLIINDGSTDNSDEVIRNIVSNSSLIINYVNHKENRHKVARLLEAIKIAKGEFFLTFDADDECTADALETFNNSYELIPNELKVKICAVTCLCVDQFGELVGNKFPKAPYYSDIFESYNVDRVKGEKWGFTKTDVLKGISYNKLFVNNGFMSVGTLWLLLARKGFLTSYINKELRIYNIGVENSISSSQIEKLALGNTIRYIVLFNWFFGRYFFQAPIFFLKNLYYTLQTSKYVDASLSNYLKAIDPVFIKVVFVILYPFRKFFN